MKRLLLIFAMSAGIHAQDVETQPVPPEVTAAAVKAVGELGREVVLGRYQVAIERMYPVWKERSAKRMGGMDKLQQQLDGVAKQMLQQGISITDFKPSGQPRPFEVYPGKTVEVIDGEQVEKLRFTKWLVLVPTVTRFRAMIQGDPVAVNIESTGFQVAICDKGKDDWTFIDGSAVTVNELRSLFITLPQDLELPPLEKKQIR
ncbi:hypothetical protein HZ994_02925 [Akkermansiaceae bacterium]|nr:hypothetical protein HZ994_02925 [Akkermansiaceae bacterium]